MATLAGNGSAASTSIRIVGESVSEVASAKSPTAAAGVLRMTVGDAVTEPTPNPVGAAGSGGSRIAIVTPNTVSSPSIAADRPDSAVTQTAFQIVEESDYAHTPAYDTLRGRLEYSQSSHQWKLRYIPTSGQTDAYGGSVVLSDVSSLKSYAPGDMVAVRGRLASTGETPDFSPAYQVDAIEPLAR